MCVPFFPPAAPVSMYFVFDVDSSKLDLTALSLETKSILCLLSKLNKYKMKLMLEFVFLSL